MKLAIILATVLTGPHAPSIAPASTDPAPSNGAFGAPVFARKLHPPVKAPRAQPAKLPAKKK